MAFETPQSYNAPPGSPSSIGPQSHTEYWLKQALVEARKSQFFTQLASVKHMPKHMGKKMKMFEYIPLLDDRNVNDQGIDAAGVQILTNQVVVTAPELQRTFASEVAMNAAVDAANAIEAGVASGASGSPWVATLSKHTFAPTTTVLGTAFTTAWPGATAVAGSGNLYGSSKDIGTITGKLPLVGEHGGRVNRVGFTRVEWEGQIFKLGFFTEFTEDQLQFDSDSSLFSRLNTELVNGAVEISEDLVQRTLLLGAGTIVYAGSATSNATVTAEGATASIVDFADLQRLHIMLNDNRTPLQTQVISGTRMIDTRTIGGGRVMYIGSELQITLENMEDQFDNPAFIPVHKYAAATNLLTGEIGTVGHFRIVVVPEMMHWAGAGAAVSANPGYRATGGRYDVYPMLVVGSDSFSCIGFQTSGKHVKFRIITKMPGEKTADRSDPYGETGFQSIRFWYGDIVYRPERIAIVKTVAAE